MPHDPQQLELDLAMGEQTLDRFVLVAQVALDRPEVEYRLSWTVAGRGEVGARIWLDAIWPIDRMSSRIIDYIVSAHESRPWEWKRVMACLNAIESAYGCEEPF